MRTSYFKILILNICILVLSTGILKAEIILELNAFKVSKAHSAEFLIDAEENDIILLTLRQAGNNNIDIDKARIQLIDLNTIDEEILEEFGVGTNQLRIPYTGMYKIKVVYEGKGFSLRNIGWKYGIFSLTVESMNSKEQKPGEYRDLLQVTRLSLDDDAENALNLIIDAKTGDELLISSADPKASIIKVEISQLAFKGFASNIQPIRIDRDISLNLKLYLAENNEEKLFTNVRDLIERGDIVIEDLIITLVKSFPTSGSAGSMSSGSPSSSNYQNDATEESTNSTDNYIAQMLELSKNSQLSASEKDQKLAEMMEASNMQQMEFTSQLIDALGELGPKEYVSVTGQEMGEVTATLGPANNLFIGNKNTIANNRYCEEISIRAHYEFWFYWVGVGDEAKTIFEEYSNEYYKRSGNRKLLANAKAEFIYYQNDPTKNLINPEFPSNQLYPDKFIEDVHYAVVNSINKDLFLRGKDYSPLTLSKNKLVSTDQGIAWVPKNPDEILYVCFENNNARTPIDVYFKYFIINEEREIR